MKRVGREWFPDTETKLCKEDTSRVADIEQHIMPHIPRTRCVVQAGAAVGIWPRKFAEYFDAVYTFEPNQALIECFERNLEKCREKDRIVLNPHGLWKEPARGRLVEHQAHNMGSWYFQPDPDGDIYVEDLDSYGLQQVDLIQLDIEGAEYEALLGAKNTLARCKPWLCIEVKMTQQFYGRKVEDLYTLLHKLGYETHSYWARDQLWKPRS